MDRYKYSVTPFSPIKELIPGKSIRAPFIADLDKDEVFLCMKHGPVFRLFPGKEPIRVTGSNFESLHVLKLEETKEVVKEKAKVAPTLTITPVAAPTVEEKVEEVVVEAPPVEENVKIFDREELKDSIQTNVEEFVAQEDETEEPVEFEEGYLPEAESEEVSVEEEQVEEPVELEEVSEESVEEEAPVEAAPTQNHKPEFKANYNEFKANYNGYSKKKNRNKNHNH